MFARTHAQSSPSVTLEQGIARLRPVRSKGPLRTIHDDRQPGTPFPTDSELKAATILASIAFVTLLAVCLALYLLSRSSRWELLSLPFQPHSKVLLSSSPVHAELRDSDPFLTHLPEPRVHPESMEKNSLVSKVWDASEKYLSYLPHSGFHNQRIALENALVLAYILNRTLLVPPILLSDHPTGYRPSRNLRVDVALSTPLGLDHCMLAASDTIFLPEECIDFWTHAHVPWAWFVDLPRVTRQHGIKTLPRWDLTDAFLQRMHLTSADTHFINDTDPYQYRFFDHQSDDTVPGPRYKERVDLPELAVLSRPDRLLQFGTLFGTTRVRLVEPAHLTVRHDVRQAMTFTNPALLRIADDICDSQELGGQWGYAAVHVRLGDGAFADSKARARNVRHVWWTLVRKLGVSDQDALEVERRFGMRKRSKARRVPLPPARLHDAAALDVPHPPQPPFTFPDLSGPCQMTDGATHPLLNIPLYIATDKPGHHALSLFTRTFPCVYFLSNFSSHLARLNSISVPIPNRNNMPSAEVLALSSDTPHPSSSSPKRGVPLARFLPAFLDAIVASKARVVVGTPGSTFSRFVEDVLWRRYHGWEIVERG